MGGDFNEILSPDKRSKGGRTSNSMRRFFDILNDLGLRDLSLQGGPYTWRGGLNGRSMIRQICSLRRLGESLQQGD